MDAICLHRKNGNYKKVPDFDILAEDPKSAATIIKERLEYEGIKKVRFTKKKGVGEIIAPHYELIVDNDTVCFIYEPLACHSYNTITIGKQKLKVATIDTMLSFYLAFLYADRPYYDHDRIICMAQYLFAVQSKNRLQQKGLLKRFSINCYGSQETLSDMRTKKADKFKELKDKRESKEYEEYFLKYVPSERRSRQSNLENIEDDEITQMKSKKKTKKRKTKKKKTKKRKTVPKLAKNLLMPNPIKWVE